LFFGARIEGSVQSLQLLSLVHTQSPRLLDFAAQRISETHIAEPAAIQASSSGQPLVFRKCQTGAKAMQHRAALRTKGDTEKCVRRISKKSK
jgi:hypothetical protein